ncbi:CCHC-type zinc finger transcription factor [Phycomyces blakesleeanus NRRL 1555(-)]|uniref:CCHC-type zinc finger transcription factor n=1 Tax=Phycomyces blakesleeanus (strain ATCC 8743b / DSM 1359 / FGSC 10004 / NBRC 33097 / NRRL 1555) TaxID=763407 RepID=A0A163E0Q4_PHYB8|nr:CCHC-type zinc finger transcription factor [Phycomyces blakesleeanus NRRL 1555(-)]OAD74590.1 CCHC-type zinc finger transcription factor [Phycomyces blakesleeanus NRRL 1555(-)]|eukprot:XP_018292630.1 CCHC-type zinc finger transcription factor [Phycomyces blakesleeanus NRRL 1555(-)]
MTNRAELLANGKVSQTVSLSDQSQFTSAMFPNLAFGENINTSSSDNMDIIDSTENDEPMNIIDKIKGTTPLLVFDFSQSLPVPRNNDKKNLTFMQLIQEFGISSCSPHLRNKLLEHFLDINADGYNICIRSCMQFNNKNDITYVKCGEARYKNGQTSKSDTRVPVRSIVQFPLARQLALCLADDKTGAEMLYYGFNPHNVPGSVTIVHATVLNLSPTIHYEKNRTIQIAILSGCTGPSDIWYFLKPTLRDLHLLQTEGMEVKTMTMTIRAKVHVLMATSNILALAKLACHVGHTMGQTPKHGQYFHMLPGTQTCSLESFRNYNLASSEDRKGLNGQSPLASIETFSGLFFFALDEMHDLCHGISKQVWGLVCRKYGIKHSLCLSLATQREIGATMVAAKSTIPTLLHSAWRDVTKNASFFRAVDWADFLLFVVLMLVAECVQDLLRVINRESALNKKSLLSTADIDIGVFTINQHIIQHYPQMIDLYGPPRAYNTRSVERAISEYSGSIKSNSQVSVNAGNIMIRLAQSQCVAELTTVTSTKTPSANLLVYSAYTNGWPVTEGGDPANAECEIEFWGPLKNLTIFNSFEDRSHLLLLLKTFYNLKGKECSMLEPSIKTSRKAYLNSCVIDAAFNQSSTREACHAHVQLQVNMNSRRSDSYHPEYKHFFGKVVIFFQHVHNSKRWLLALITIYSVHLKNGLLITPVVKPKTIVIHASDIIELVGLVPSNVNGSHYIIWSSLKRGPKLTLGALREHLINGYTNTSPTITIPTPGLPLTYLTVLTNTTLTFHHAIVLGSNDPLTKPRTWQESTSQFSVYYTTPWETSPKFIVFFDALLQSYLPGEIFGLHPSNKAGTLFELHLSSKDVYTCACCIGFWYNNETVLASPAIASSSKLFKLTLSKLPRFPPQEYTTLDIKLHNALTKYGYVHNISINTLFGFMNGSGHTYVERPPYEEGALLPLCFKMDFDDNTTFLATWLNMGAHCALCQTMGHDCNNCPNRPKETCLCYGCHQVGHLCSKCPHAAKVDNSYKWDCKVPELQGPHRTTATCNTTNQPTVTHSGSHMKKTLPPPSPQPTFMPYLTLPSLLPGLNTTPPTSPKLETLLTDDPTITNDDVAEAEAYFEKNCKDDPMKAKTNHSQTRSLFIRHLRSCGIDILALQETHANTEPLQQMFHTQFHAQDSLWSPHCSLVSLSPHLSLINSLFSPCGRCISTTVIHTNNSIPSFLICVVYSPASYRDCFSFLRSLLNSPALLPRLPSSCILLGDFNYTYHTTSSNPRQAPPKWLNFIFNYFVDCITLSDYVFASSNLAPCHQFSSVSYIHPNWSDYCLVATTFKFTANHATGKGMWCANPRLACNPTFCTEFDAYISTSIFLLSPYMSPQDQWDRLKHMLANFIKSFTRCCTQTLTTLEARIQSKRDKLIHKFRQQPAQNFQLPIIERQLQQVQLERVEILALHAGKHWRENGEISTGYLKQTVAECQARKNITKLCHPITDHLHTEPDDMTEAAASFYESLYTPEPIDQLAIDDLLCHLPNDLCMSCSPQTSIPGPDGLPYEILQLIFHHHSRSQLLTQVYNDALSSGQFPSSWQTTCVSLLPKKDDLSSLKN